LFLQSFERSAYPLFPALIVPYGSKTVAKTGTVPEHPVNQIYAIEVLKASREPLAMNRAEALNVESTETDGTGDGN
jgi:hypothetical protein